jgi:hypothetical protein
MSRDAARARRVDRVDVEAIVARYRTVIDKAVPGARSFLTGSSLLGSFSGHDIDLVVLVADVSAAVRKLRGLYPPLYEDEWRDDWAAFRDPGPPQVDIVVTVPGTNGDARAVHRRWRPRRERRDVPGTSRPPAAARGDLRPCA